jgi:hypothetical protein
MFGKNPAWVGYLRTFGEVGTVKTDTYTMPKFHDKGVQCMFVGYVENHKGGVYRMWNHQMRKVHITRDVISCATSNDGRRNHHCTNLNPR